MSIIGKQIKKYRTEKGFTQEQLGELLGVTTQAVSKWERGGTPDAELLPQLSKVLNVSIDALFGCEEQSFVVSLAHRIAQMPSKEAYRYAFCVCWSMIIGFMKDISMVDIETLNGFLKTFLECATISYDNSDYISQIMQDEGMITARMSPDLNFIFMMVEPEKGIKENLTDQETLRKVFEILADKKALSIIYYMYTRLNTPIASSLISKNTNLSIEEVEKYMRILCERNLATRNVVSTADGDINSYMFNFESAVVPLLCFADQICRKDFHDFAWALERKKPIFKPQVDF